MTVAVDTVIDHSVVVIVPHIHTVDTNGLVFVDKAVGAGGTL